jgi:hypothetical protein
VLENLDTKKRLAVEVDRGRRLGVAEGAKDRGPRT